MHLALLLLCALLIAPASQAEPVHLKGSNGRVVEFAGVRLASPQGLTLLMQVDGDEMLVPWDKFDLEDLKKNEAIYTAYEKASSGQTTQLNLGVYEGAMTKAQFLQGLRKELSKKESYPVAKLSDFFDHKDDDQSYMSTNKSQDANAAKRSKRFVREYEQFVEEFYRLKNVDYSRDTITWTYIGEDPYVIVREAYPRGKTSVELTSLQVLEYFANDDNGSRNKAAKYFNYRPPQIQPVSNTLREYKRIAQTKLLADETTKYRYAYLLNQLLEDYEGFRETTTLPSSLVRDTQGFLREMKLSGP